MILFKANNKIKNSTPSFFNTAQFIYTLFFNISNTVEEQTKSIK